MKGHFLSIHSVLSIFYSARKLYTILLFLLGSTIVNGQVNIDELKGAIILHLCENVEWPEKKQEQFTIGFLSNDQQIFKALKKIESSIKIQNKTVKLIDASSFSELKRCNTIYFNKYNIGNIDNVFEQALKNNILLITDNYDDPLDIQVNLIQDGNRMAFKINMANLTLAKLSVKPNILLNGGSVVDIKTAFEEFNTKIKEGREKLLLSEKELKEKEAMLKNKDVLIANRESIMQKYLLKLDSLSKEAQKNTLLADQQKKELLKKEEEIENKNNELTTIYQDIENKQKDLNSLQSNITETQKKADLLQIEVENKNKVLIKKDENIKNQRKLLWLSISMLAGFMVAALIISRLFLLKRKLNFELQNTNQELQKAIHELNSKNEIINSQNNELTSTLENLKATQAQLIQAEKMASLGILTAGVSHEINNPLNYLSGVYYGLENYFEKFGTNDKDTTDLLLSSTEIAINRISDIVKGLNQFSRDESRYDEDCDIHSIIDNCLTVLYNQYKNKADIKKEYSSKIHSIKGNVGKLHQLFLNVLSNSIESIHNKGHISIKTIYLDENIEIEISDTGCGISEENLSRITDPFFTTKQPGEGPGLGLSISYSIIKEHNGNINFESELDKGTKAIIKLPINSK